MMDESVGPFPKQELVRQMHKLVFHVFAQSGDEMESLFKEQLRQRGANVATIPEQLAAQMFDHAGHRIAIVHVPWSQATGQQFSLIVDGQMQFEPKEPSHARFPSSGIRRKDAMLTNSFGITDLECSRIDEADACASSIPALQIGQHRNQHGWNKSDK